MSFSDEFELLASLHERGVLTDDEFEVAKQRVVKESVETSDFVTGRKSSLSTEGVESYRKRRTLIALTRLSMLALLLVAVGFAGIVPYHVPGSDCSPPIVEVFRPAKENPNYNPNPRDMFNKNKMLPDVCESGARQRLVVTVPVIVLAAGGIWLLRDGRPRS